MDFGTIIIGIIVIALSMLPFGFAYYKRLKGDKKMLFTLKEFALQHSQTLSSFELCGDFAIGMDANSSFIFFLKEKKEGSITQFIDLGEIQSCEVVKQVRTVQLEHESVRITERIDLCFWSNGNNKGATILELFDDQINLQLSGELQFVDTWSGQINKILKHVR